MGFRNLVITSHAKLTYSNGMIIIQNYEGIKQLPVTDVNILLVDSTQVMISSYLIAELMQSNTKLIFTDKLHQPVAETVPYYANNQSVEMIEKQVIWTEQRKKHLWTKIVYEKIFNQAKVLEILKFDPSTLIEELDKVEYDDQTNREALAAQKYFPLLFGENFSRRNNNVKNKALDYGYSLLLSVTNKEIVGYGCLTQLGIHHCNKSNYFNLGSDLMEIFRPIVDLWVKCREFEEFTPDIKYGLIYLLDAKIKFNGKNMVLANAIKEHVLQCFKYLNGEIEEIRMELELTDEVQNNAITSNV